PERIAAALAAPHRALWVRASSAYLGVVTVPQRLSYVTLGARNMAVLRRFYPSLGGTERPGSDDNFATFDAGGVLLALYPIEHLGAEAAPTEPLPPTGWNGTTLGINVESTA